MYLVGVAHLALEKSFENPYTSSDGWALKSCAPQER
jgi:hypothetical protein